jgi:hypothetical protein
MHLAPVMLAVSCALQQAPAPTFALNVINNTRHDFVEFRIRASDSGRPWTTVRLEPRATQTISLVSNDPFDVEIWRWAGNDSWIVSRESEVHLKDDPDWVNRVRMDQVFSHSAGDEPYGFEYVSLRYYGGKNRKFVDWQLRSNPFMLVVPR